MSKIHFTMVPKYASGWGLWEGLREVLQNALDSNDLENPMTVYHKEGNLFVENLGTQVGVESFLLGETDKDTEESLRGKHGEGLTLALMAFCRAGISAKVFSGDFCWAPSIEHVEKLNGVQINRELFTLTQTEYPDDPFYGVKVQVEIEEGVWDSFKTRFLPLVEDEIPSDKIYRCRCGALLMEERFKGQIFSQGIYVQTMDDFKYGYDLKLKLDRDRNTVPDFDVQWAAGNVLSSYESSMEEMKSFDLVCEGNREARYMDLGPKAKERFGEAFQEKHGKDAVPVTTDDEAKDVRRVGMNPVIVPDKAKEILSGTSVPRASDLKRNYSVQVSKRYELSDLDAQSRLRFEKAVGEIQSLVSFCKLFRWEEEKTLLFNDTGVSKEVVTFLKETEIVFKVVELSDSKLDMMSCKELSEVGISRRELSGTARILRSLFRGIVHLGFEQWKISSINTGIDDLWTLLYYSNL
jgi:hypothetical protein